MDSLGLYLLLFGPALLLLALGIWAAVKWKGWWSIPALLPAALAWGLIPWSWIVEAMYPGEEPLMAIIFPGGSILGLAALGVVALVRLVARKAAPTA